MLLEGGNMEDTRKQCEQDALQHPNTWCTRDANPNVSARYIPETLKMQVRISNETETLTGEVVKLPYPVIASYSVRA